MHVAALAADVCDLGVILKRVGPGSVVDEASALHLG